MKLLVKGKKYCFARDDTIAIFLSGECKKDIDKGIPVKLSFVRDNIEIKYFKGKLGETLFLPFKDFPNVIMVGIGKKNDITKDTFRNASNSVVEICKKVGVKSIIVLFPSLDKHDSVSVISSIAEGLYLSNYIFDKYKTKEKDRQSLLKEAGFYIEKGEDLSKLFREIEIVSENTLLCRNLVNEISDICNPLEIAKEAKLISKIKGVTCKVFGKRDIERMKMGLLMAVSQGSKYPPQLIVLSYTGDPKSNKVTAIVGKGITFDSGGINLKPSGHIEDMRSDMSGAAACLYTIKAAAEIKMKKNITAVIPLCENMIGSRSYKPGDVFVGYNKKSVEVGNTDAEGRLILADALAYTEDKIKPDCIIDIATLTGACLVCLGETIAGLLSNNDKLADVIFQAGEKSGDRVWRLPLYREYEDDMKSDIADLKNISSGRNAGTIMGAIFLKNFIKDTTVWAHIDIAGTSWYSKQRGYKPKYSTGFGVRLFIEVLKEI